MPRRPPTTPTARRAPAPALGLGLALGVLGALVPAVPGRAARRLGASPMPESPAVALLVDYFETYRREQDIDAFRRSVEARYTEGTLGRLLQGGEAQARRAAVLALGLVGTMRSNATVARALRDADPIVRDLAGNALWAIWFRADSPEHNALLEEVHDLNNRGRYRDAEALADRLIGRAPDFAEAFNQRAIARFGLARFDDSAADCQRVLRRNPYHFGALSGLAQCQLQLGRRDDALKTFRRALRLQPYNQGLRRAVAVLEGE